MLLGVIVVAGVTVRVLDARHADADRTAERPAQAQREDDDDTPEPPPTTTTAPAEPGPAIPDDTPLRIDIGQVAAIDGGLVDTVRSLGPVTLGSQSTIPAVAAQIGEPDSLGAAVEDPNICDATWVAMGLEARFYFGHPPSPEASCAKGPVVVALMTGARWHVPAGPQAGDATLAVGDSEQAIATAFPEATSERLPPGLATFAQSPEGYVLAVAAYGTQQYPTLYAIPVNGSIASFLYVSGAD